MRSLILVSALAALGVGCTKGGAPDKKAAQAEPAAQGRKALLGQWTVDPARLGEQAQFADMPAEQKALSLDMARNVVRSMSFEFTEDRFSLTMAGKTIDGTYAVETEAPTRLVLALTETGGEKSRMTVDVQSAGLVIHPAEGESLPLVRK